MQKFGAPGTVIHDYENWCVLLRPAQVTLGSLVLVARDSVTAFSDLGPASFAELKKVTGDIEKNLKNAFSYEKLNYLMLMMVDPDVHFHVIPRYAGERNFGSMEFADEHWPGPPDVTASIDISEDLKQQLLEFLRENWIL